MKLKMIIGGLAAAVVVLTGGYDRLRDYVELWTGDRFLPVQVQRHWQHCILWTLILMIN